MWTIQPSPQAIKALLDFWRQTGEDGQIRYDLTDPEWNTRFLGDLYQDLSEAARKTYALLQTPEFVEEFILNYTLDPAIEEFGLEPDAARTATRTCRPACASSTRPAAAATSCSARSAACWRRGKQRSADD